MKRRGFIAATAAVLTGRRLGSLAPALAIRFRVTTSSGLAFLADYATSKRRLARKTR